MRHRPYSLVGPGQALVSLLIALPPRGAERRQTRGFCETPDGWPAKPSGGTLCEGAPSLREKRGASRRSTAAFYRCAGRASENVDQPRLSASSWRQVVVPASGAPPSPGGHGVRCSEPAAPHQSTAGFPRLDDPASLGAYLRPCLTAAPSSRRPMSTPLEEQDMPIMGIFTSMSIVLVERICAALRSSLSPSFTGRGWRGPSGPSRVRGGARPSPDAPMRVDLSP